MASSSNQRSSSSASRPSKPTFRRASGASQPVSRSFSSKPAGKRAASTGASKASGKKSPVRAAASGGASKPRSGLGGASLKPKASASKPRISRAAAPAAAPAARKGAPGAAGKASLLKKSAALGKPAPQKGAKVAKVAKAAPSGSASPAGSKPAGAASRPAATTPAARSFLKKTQARERLAGVTTVQAKKEPTSPGRRGVLGRIAGVLAGAFGALRSGRVITLAIAIVVALAVGGVVVVNGPFFSATDIQISGSEHVPRETVERLVEIPAGTTLLNANADAIGGELLENPWVSGITLEREFPHTLKISPTERAVAAIVYITADDVAWAVGDDACWIAPISLSVTVDAEGNVVREASQVSADQAGSDDAAGDSGDAAADPAPAPAEGEAQTTTLSGIDAARALARADGAILFTDVPADIEPSSGAAVDSEVVLAGIEYARGFSDEFIAKIQSISLTSVDAISCYLDSGVEIALGVPEDIETKERVVTRLLEQQQGVTYINVRTPDHYTFRSAPSA